MLVDALLLSLFEIAVTAQWDRWLDMLRDAFGATAAVLVPLAAAADGPKNGQAFPEFGAWLAALRAAPFGAPPVVHVLPVATSSRRGPARGSAVGMGAVLAAGPNRFALLLRRDGDSAPFGPADVVAFARIAAFVEQTLEVRRAAVASAAEAEAFRQVLNQSRRGFVLLDAFHRVVFANAFAKELLHTGRVVRLRGGQLVARNPADERPFRDAVERALGDPGAQAIVTLHGADDEVEIVATVRGTDSPETEFGRPGAIAVVRLSRALPDRTEMAPGHLEQLFAFTPKEARVASLLVAGLDLSEVAAQLSITTGTTRHHLKAIFAKTGLHRQRDLVHLLRMALPPEEMPMRGN